MTTTKIKYRVWDDKNKSYDAPYSHSYYAMTQDGVLDFYCRGDCFDSCDPDVYFIEQYTGLKDKNGKEIYEGDIVEETVTIEGDAEEYRRYRVYWEDTRLCWCVMDHTWFRDELWQTNASREVIGNVHENPELVGGKE